MKWYEVCFLKPQSVKKKKKIKKACTALHSVNICSKTDAKRNPKVMLSYHNWTYMQQLFRAYEPFCLGWVLSVGLVCNPQRSKSLERCCTQFPCMSKWALTPTMQPRNTQSWLMTCVLVLGHIFNVNIGTHFIQKSPKTCEKRYIAHYYDYILHFVQLSKKR